MSHPDWASPELSKDMPVLRARGENQDLEYKREFPSNARDLAKEIAAFATTNDGMILLGVADDGELVGLLNCDSASGRDDLIQRLEGVIQSIKPPITPSAKFSVENGKIILVISVPRGSHPVYFANNIAYVRQLTRARPAEPEEIRRLIIDDYQRSQGSPITQGTEDAGAKESALYSRIATLLVNVLVAADEYDERQVNPWLDLWRSSFANIAAELRDLAATEEAITEGVDTRLAELSHLLDTAAHMRLHLGSGNSLRKATAAAREMAEHLFETLIRPIPVSNESRREIQGAIRELARRLANLRGRAEDMIERGGTTELQAEASRIGYSLAQMSYYDIGLPANFQQRLRSIGRSLHLLETVRRYMDGGQSEEAIASRVAESSADLNGAIEAVSM